MLDSILRSMLGDYGEVILDFYLEYNLIINGILLFYALIVSFSYKSYHQALSTMISFLQENHAQRLEKKSVKELVYLLEKFDLPWDEVKKSYWFPLIAKPRSIIPRMKKLETMESLISLSLLADEYKNFIDRNKNNG